MKFSWLPDFIHSAIISVILWDFDNRIIDLHKYIFVSSRMMERGSDKQCPKFSKT